MRYVHAKLKEEVEAIGGHYVVEKELRLPHSGREVLVVIGHAVIDRSCCGFGGMGFANVAGYVSGWKVESADDGSPVSEVESVADETVRSEIRALVEREAPHRQVRFL
ncbi:MAG: hypothetical protein HY897_10555 [Deltaproteobacteria bacterium]|nr:hypothetical protein [Deltaproteobacteria bacterium]